MSETQSYTGTNFSSEFQGCYGNTASGFTFAGNVLSGQDCSQLCINQSSASVFSGVTTDTTAACFCSRVGPTTEDFTQPNCGVICPDGAETNCGTTTEYDVYFNTYVEPSPTDTGSSSVPPSDTGSSAVPPSDTGSSAVPPSDTGSSAIPPSETGSSAIPPSDTGSSVVPPSGTSSSVVPATDTGSDTDSSTGGPNSDTASDAPTLSPQPSPSATSDAPEPSSSAPVPVVVGSNYTAFSAGCYDPTKGFSAEVVNENSTVEACTLDCFTANYNVSGNQGTTCACADSTSSFGTLLAPELCAPPTSPDSELPPRKRALDDPYAVYVLIPTVENNNTSSEPSVSSTASGSNSSSSVGSQSGESSSTLSNSSASNSDPSSTASSSAPSTISVAPTTTTTTPVTSTMSSTSSIVVPTGVTTVSSFSTANVDWTYVSCWGEPASGRALYQPIDNSALFTVESCLSLATTLGFSNAGLEYGGECWATNGKIYGGSIPETYCSQSCKGDTTQACGNGNILSLYKATVRAIAPVNSYSSGSQPWTYQSCWGEPAGGGRALEHKLGNGVTIQQCLDLATKGGYANAGLEYGGECWAAGYKPRGGKVPESYCSQACSASPLQACGNGNILSLYTASAITVVSVSVANGKTWSYESCWGEPKNGRALYQPIDNNARASVESCLSAGQARGFTLCGLEYGGECWCSYGQIYGGKIPASYCNMPCKGLGRQICGGSNVLSVYRLH